MSTTNKSGFTVIETMLFLAISGALIVALLVGSGASINIQRYKDSVVGLQSVIQNQYFQVTNVSNVPPAGALTCGADAKIVIDEAAPPSYRGRDKCVILGRFITIDRDVLKSYTVIGSDPSAELLTEKAYSNDIDEFASYNFSLMPGYSDIYNIEWGSEIAWPSVVDGTQNSNTTPRSFSMLIIRSPSSGRMYTFSSDGIVDSDRIKKDLLVIGTEEPGRQAEQRLCIVSTASSFSQNQAIYIKPYASNANSIEVRSNEIDNGDDSSC